MREILFRGKRIDNGKWYYGSYLFLHARPIDWNNEYCGKAEDCHFIIDDKDINYAVDPETVGQFTGLTDKNGKKIFEHDEIEYDDTPYTAYAEKQTGRIVWRYGSLCFEYSVFGGVHYRAMCSEDFFAAKSTVIGNIHDKEESE